jgi:hypothetical protein
MDRREAIQRVAFLMGGTISAPALIGLLEGCQPKSESVAYKSFTPEVEKLIAEIAETIIPETNTPGAKAAKVEQFIVTMMQDCYPENDQKIFFSGLEEVDKQSRKDFDKSYVELTDAQRIEVFKKIESAAFEQREKDKDKKEKDPLFYFQMKELALLGYFTSEIGATKALAYVHVPGAYNGCVPMKPGQKAWAI